MYKWEGMDLCMCICAHTYVYVYMRGYIYILFATDWCRSSLQTGSTPPPPFLLHTYLHMHQCSLDPWCYTRVCKWRTETVRAGETAGSRSHRLEWAELTSSTPGANLLHIMECEVHREGKHKLRPQNNQLPQTPSDPSAVEFGVSYHPSHPSWPSWGCRMPCDESAASPSTAAGQERGKEGSFFRSEFCWRWLVFFHDWCLDANMLKERQSWFDRSVLVLRWNSWSRENFQPCGKLLML